MKYIVYIVFGIFVFILAIVGLYFLLALVLKKRDEQIVEEKRLKILNLFNDLLHSDKKETENDVLMLKECFTTDNGFKAFHLAYQNFIAENEVNEEIRSILVEIVDYETIYKNKRLKESYRKSYAFYLMSEFQLESGEAIELSLRNLSDPSFYVRINALKVIQNQTNVKTILTTLDIINERREYYNKRVIVDFLDTFRGNQQELDQQLIHYMDAYTEELISIILEHFTNTENDNQEVQDRILDYLLNSSSIEIVLRSTRYFSVVIDEKAKSIIFENLSHKDWRVRTTSANAIGRYADDKVVGQLKNSLTDLNYFVRRNAALSLVKVISKEELFYEAVSNDDAFARDTLVYLIESEELEGFEDYKISMDIEAEKSNIHLNLETSGI